MRTSALMQPVNVLGDDRLDFAMPLKVGKRNMRLVRFCRKHGAKERMDPAIKWLRIAAKCAKGSYMRRIGVLP
jgi:hypothetical protein